MSYKADIELKKEWEKLKLMLRLEEIFAGEGIEPFPIVGDNSQWVIIDDVLFAGIEGKTLSLACDGSVEKSLFDAFVGYLREAL